MAPTTGLQLVDHQRRQLQIERLNNPSDDDA
jgi:hypothetical protein